MRARIIPLTLLTATSLWGCGLFEADKEEEPLPTSSTTVFTRDDDGDGVSASSGDCDDSDPAVYPGAPEVPYDGVDQDCEDGDVTDVDGDGQDAVEVGGPDCDDTDPSVGLGEPEVPYDGTDQDCDGADLTDVDHDGFDAIEAGGTDCDDEDGRINPGMPDDCGDGDEDCDGEEDEDQDLDGDGFTTCDDDCDDEDPDVFPGAVEVALDGIDQNCDGRDRGNCDDNVLDEGYDLELDFHAYDCSIAASYGGIGWVHYHAFRIPEDATCEDGTIEFWVEGLELHGGDKFFTGRFFDGPIPRTVVTEGRFWGEATFERAGPDDHCDVASADYVLTREI